MFGFGFWEIAVILVAALLLFGPKKLPELARSLGRGLREFRKATEDFKSTMDAELHAPEEDRPKPPTPAKLPDTVARAPAYGDPEPAQLEKEPVSAAPTGSSTEASGTTETPGADPVLGQETEPSAPTEPGPSEKKADGAPSEQA